MSADVASPDSGATPLMLITGAGGGIGQAAARRAADAGYRLVLLDLDTPALADTLQAVRERGADAEAVACDIGDGGAVAAVFADGDVCARTVGTICWRTRLVEEFIRFLRSESLAAQQQ